jgi:hypothetical protein
MNYRFRCETQHFEAVGCGTTFYKKQMCIRVGESTFLLKKKAVDTNLTGYFLDADTSAITNYFAERWFLLSAIRAAQFVELGFSR